MKKRASKKILNKLIITVTITIIFAIASYFGIELENYINDMANKYKISYTTSFDLSSIPEFTNEPYVVLNNNQPEFAEEDFEMVSFEQYSELDYLGRCGPAFAKVGIETIPTEERGEIGGIKPSGWQTIKYKGVEV